MKGVEPYRKGRDADSYRKGRDADMENDNDEDGEDDLIGKIEELKAKLKKKRKLTIAALPTEITEEDDEYDGGKGSQTGLVIGCRGGRKR